MTKREVPRMDLSVDAGREFISTVDGVERHYVDLNSFGKTVRKAVEDSIKISTIRERALQAQRTRRSAGLRIGYAFWGFLGDHKEDAKGNQLSTPDGNATYSWCIVHEAARRGHQVFPMMPDRDWPAHQNRGYNNFRAFAQDLRWKAYGHLVQNGLAENSHAGFPDLDVLLLEWRFPIPGRNTVADMGKPGYQPDLDRQYELLGHYLSRGTRVVVWDLDHKLTALEEQNLLALRTTGEVVVFETSMVPLRQHIERVSVEPPCIVETLLTEPQRDVGPGSYMAYIGSRYERDKVVDEWIRPIANRDRFRGRIHFYGKWEQPDCSIRWPGVNFHDRVTLTDFPGIYSRTAAVPLLAKPSYRDCGFMTPRPWEALMYGAIPVGLAGHLGVERYVDLVVQNAEDLGLYAEHVYALTTEHRFLLRKRLVEKIAFMDARHFVDKLEGR